MASSPTFIESVAQEQTGAAPDQGVVHGHVHRAKVISISDGPSRRQTMSIEALYPDMESASGALRSALRLTESAITLIRQAASLQWSDPVGSDDRMSRLVPLLLELFCWRELGDGFAAVVNALYHGVKNHMAATWTGTELKTVADVLFSVRSEPYMGFERALEHIDQLEAAGLAAEPREFDALADWLDAQSVG